MSNFVSTQNWELQLQDVKVEDSGQYTCQVRDKYKHKYNYKYKYMYIHFPDQTQIHVRV